MCCRKTTGRSLLIQKDPPRCGILLNRLRMGAHLSRRLRVGIRPITCRRPTKRQRKRQCGHHGFAEKHGAPLKQNFPIITDSREVHKLSRESLLRFYHFYIFRQLREHEISPRSNPYGYLLHNCYIFRIIYRDAQPRHGTNRIGPLSTPRTPRDTPRVLQTWQQAPLRHRAA